MTLSRLKDVSVALKFLIVFALFVQQAYPGVLDPTFGTNGKVTTNFPFTGSSNYSSSGYTVFIQPSGRIVGMGYHDQPGPDGQAPGVATVGLTQSGAIDKTFSGGKTLDWDSFAVTGLSDALMLADGRTLRLSQYFTVFGQHILKLKRVNVDGDIDAGFNPDLRINGTTPYPEKFAVQNDGKIIVLVQLGVNDNFYLIRINSDGSRDTTFGTNGVKPLTRFNSLPHPYTVSMQVLPNGKIVLAGSLGPQYYQNQNEFFVARLDPNGDVDHSFGRLGVARQTFGGKIVFPENLLIQPNGRCILIGSIKNPDSDTLMMRFTPRGKPDTTFGTEGVVIADFTVGGDDFGVGATLMSNGKIIVAGQAFNSLSTFSNFLVARFSAGGILEASTQTAITPLKNSGASDVIIQPDGKFLVIGYTRNPDKAVNGNVFAFARYTDITND